MSVQQAPKILQFEQERDHYIAYSDSLCEQGDQWQGLYGAFVRMVASQRDAIIQAYKNGSPFVCNIYGAAPEILEAMELPWYRFHEAPYIAPDSEELERQHDASASMGLGADLNPATRAGIYQVEQGVAPLPTVVIDYVYPGDDMFFLHQVIKRNRQWKAVPSFFSDSPTYAEDQIYDYFAGELIALSKFLEHHTGSKFDLDNLKLVIEKSNTQYRLLQEYDELCKQSPCCSITGLAGANSFAVAQMFAVGRSEGVQWFEGLLAQSRICAENADASPEKVRLFWFDLMLNEWAQVLGPWLRSEYGAVIVADNFVGNPCEMIDTSSEASIWTGLAKRGLLDNPLVRQTTQTADQFVHDLEVIVKRYAIDVVIWPGFLWQKEVQGAHGIIREACKSLGVEFFDLRMNYQDQRAATLAEVKEKFARYFRLIGVA